ncbi:hypothetical protein [Mesorhizobium sp.]|uniref:hypothetical protein n=1 Tax=Mesorhizobium sp. TaxID=1871066 RepID=UPI0025B9A0B0|nr:hypothetical protein [Mesorhizobium sp.]
MPDFTAQSARSCQGRIREKQSVDSLDELPEHSFFVPGRADPFDALGNANINICLFLAAAFTVSCRRI